MPLPLRRWLRRHLPAEVRLRIALLRRALRDRWHGVRFAVQRAEQPAEYLLATYESAFTNFAGQEGMAEGKRQNQRLLAAALDGTILAPGETFSLWHLVGRPTAERGYRPAAGIKNGVFTQEEVGGSTCQMATVIYNVALLAGLDIVERHAHSLDTYGDHRYFELGRDATIEYAYLDLRFRNPHAYPVTLHVGADDDGIAAQARAPVPKSFVVELVVTPAAPVPPRRSPGTGSPSIRSVASETLPENARMISASRAISSQSWLFPLRRHAADGGTTVHPEWLCEQLVVHLGDGPVAVILEVGVGQIAWVEDLVITALEQAGRTDIEATQHRDLRDIRRVLEVRAESLETP